MVVLLPMLPEDWARWREDTIRRYADDKVRIGAWPAESAVAMATRDFHQVLPDGQATAGHDFRSIVTETGQIVGTLWFGAGDELTRRAAFIWDITVNEDQRGRGHGRAALAALEPVASALGYDAISLHVFGDNEVARNLYRSSGYVETDVSMTKRLG